MRTYPFVALVALALPAAFSSHASADVPAAPSSAATSFPDVIMLKDGNMVRGTIVELDKTKEVTIQTPTGKTRTIPMTEVEYAGPEANRPRAAAAPPALPPPPPPPQVASRPQPPVQPVGRAEVPVRFTANMPNVTLHVRTGSSVANTYGFTSRGTMMSGVSVGRAYADVCVAPCETSLPVGSLPLALSYRDGNPIEASGAIPVRGPSRIHGEYTSYAGTRLAGLFTMLGGAIAGTIILVTARGPDDRYGQPTYNNTQAIPGAIVLFGGVLVGTILMFKRDEIQIGIAPLAAPAAPTSSPGRPTTSAMSVADVRSSLLPTGAGLVGQF